MRSGQSLMEIMIAVAIGVILVAGALAIISPTMKTGSDSVRVQVAAALSKEMLENARVMSEGSWHALVNLSTTSANKYYLIASTSPFTVATGTESVLVSTTTYSRYFYLEDVYRNGSNKIDTAGTTLDPSVKRIVVVSGWASTTASTTSYLARTQNSVFDQTDWSGGGGQAGPITSTSTNSKFASSSNITTTSTVGSIVIQGL